jgi:hypothetical protein
MKAKILAMAWPDVIEDGEHFLQCRVPCLISVIQRLF